MTEECYNLAVEGMSNWQ